jgi:hypothetical protein
MFHPSEPVLTGYPKTGFGLELQGGMASPSGIGCPELEICLSDCDSANGIECAMVDLLSQPAWAGQTPPSAGLGQNARTVRHPPPKNSSPPICVRMACQFGGWGKLIR